MQNSETSSSLPPTEMVLQPLPPEEWPSIDHIITEDGAPVDNVFSEKQMRLLTEPLYSSWQTDRVFVALSNVGLFYGVDLPPIVPDTLLSMDVRLSENLFPKINRSYFVWKYGKPPEVVIEIVSNRSGGEDTVKLDRYASIPIANYFIFDPEHHLSPRTLRAYRLVGNEFLLDESGSRQVPGVGVGLTLWQGTFEATDALWLRWVDGHGVLIPTGAENAKAEKQRAQTATKNAQIAEQQARAAEVQAREAEHQARAAELQTRAAEQQTRESDQRTRDAELQSRDAQQQAVAEKLRADVLADEKAALLELLRKHGIDPTAAG